MQSKPNSKLRVGVLFGGRSGEHEVSLLSAASILNAIDKSKFDVVPIGITKEGQWVTAGHAERLLKGSHHEEEKHLRAGDPQHTPGAAVLATGEAIIVPPVPHVGESVSLLPFDSKSSPSHHSVLSPVNVDVIFPVLHGTFGEDGTVQGLLELADIAYVGAGVLGSAAGMDKDVMKKLFAAAGLPIVKHVTILRSEWEEKPKQAVKRIESKLKYPLFVKPANLGSSVGISKAHDRKELGPAIEEAARYDRKIVIEQGVGGKKRKAREIECSVLGNDSPTASIAGEVVPAKLTKKQLTEVQQTAIAAFKAVDCSGLARVDFLMDPGSKDAKLYVNEINTMPGFTSISMYPKLWQASGLAYSDLITQLIELALERHRDKKRNQYGRQ